MPTISSSLLTDTLNVIALARETALAEGGEAQAERLTPVVDGLRTLAASTSAPAAPSGLLAQADFQALMARAQSAPAPALTDKAHLITAMSAGGMGEVDIARQLGMTREEVKLMLAASQPARSGLNIAQRYSK
jgi:hypothetical protein